MDISFLDLFLAIFSQQVAIYISSKSLIKKLNDKNTHFTFRKMLITTIPLYLYSSPRTKCLKLIKYPFFRKSPKHLKIISYYVVYILHLYLYGKSDKAHWIISSSIWYQVVFLQSLYFSGSSGSSSSIGTRGNVHVYGPGCAAAINTFRNRGKYWHIL